MPAPPGLPSPGGSGLLQGMGMRANVSMLCSSVTVQRRRRALFALLLTLVPLTACREAPPPATTSAPATPGVVVAPPASAVVPAGANDAPLANSAAPALSSIPASTAATGSREAAASPTRIVLPSLDFLPGPLYFCDVGGERRAIEYEPRVDDLCRRHPEMSPCQYERNACRAGGGRVFTARAEEVTPAIEAEYDRSVRRVTFGDSANTQR
jgi:hypothetical protein